MKIELTAIPNPGNYALRRLRSSDVAGFDPVTLCPACRGERWRVLASLGETRQRAPALSLRACESCGHVTYDRLPSAAWLAHYYAEEWDRGRKQVDPAQVKLRATNPSPWAMAPHLRDLRIPKDARILDFGCGFGDGLFALKHEGYRNLFGVEVGRHRFEVASRYFPDSIRHGSIDAAVELAREHGPFDVITLNHVAEHLRDPGQIVVSLVELLSPTGTLVVSVPHPRSESPVHLPLYFAHLHHFSASSLGHLLSRAGLRPARWARSTIQLAVAGSRSGLSGLEGYEPIELGTAPALVADLERYVRAPWQLGDDGESITLNYFHPWSGGDKHSGYRRLRGAAEHWFGKAVPRLVPLFGLAERSGVDSHNLLRRAVLKGSRLAFRDGAPSGGDLVRYRVLARDQEPPWLVDGTDDVPVFDK